MLATVPTAAVTLVTGCVQQCRIGMEEESLLQIDCERKGIAVNRVAGAVDQRNAAMAGSLQGRFPGTWVFVEFGEMAPLKLSHLDGSWANHLRDVVMGLDSNCLARKAIARKKRGLGETHPTNWEVAESVEASLANRIQISWLQTHVGHESDGEHGEMRGGWRCTKRRIKSADSDRNKTTRF